MRLRQYFEQEQKPRSTQRVRSKNTPQSVLFKVAAHTSFVPMVSAWGAALLGLSVVVLPGGTVSQIAAPIGLDVLGGSVKFVFAGVAALLGGGLAFVIANALHARARRSVKPVSIVSNVTSRRVRPINPAAELGSDSLDAPIDKMPFGSEEERTEDGEFEELSGEDFDALDDTSEPQPTLGELAQRGYDIEAPEEDAADQGFTRSAFKMALIETCEGATCEAAPAEKPAAETAPVPEQAPELAAKQPLGRPASSAASTGNSWSLTQFTPEKTPEAPKNPETAPLAEKPRALDLAEFAELPGRNGVWVEEETPEAPAPQAATPQAATPKPRAVPDAINPAPVGALEKLRQTPTQDLSLVQMVERFAGALHDHQQAERSRLPKNGVGRDAALAEALKALTLFTERGFDQPNVSNVPASNHANETELGQTERELRDALAKLQNLRGAA